MSARFLAFALLFLLSASSLTAAERMNVLFLLADDWRHDTLGCAGNPVVKTPHLDALAADGFRFTRACVTTSVCGVSRASLLTGQWMSRHGNPDFKMFTTPWRETFPGLMRQNGYWVGHVGKWHNGKFPASEFDFARSYMGKHWIKEPGAEPIHVTQKNEKDALEFLQTRPKDRPFCLTVSFFAAHAEDNNPRQYLPQPGSESLYANVEIPVPPTANEEALRRLPPFLQASANEGRKRWTWRFDTPAKYQEMMKNYYRLCSEVDSTCGRLVAELQSQGLLENTLIVFTGDNGYFHGERGLADKWYPYEESIRVPLIVRDPRMPKEGRGKTSEEFVLNVDVAPTFLSAAGITTPSTMQGRDFSPLYLAQGEVKPEWRKEFFYEHSTITSKERIPASQALVRRDAKYSFWPEYEYEELFDLVADPGEQNNLVKSPEKKELLEAMRARFRELREKAK
jgi:arylsulfatase A-like enzyme